MADLRAVDLRAREGDLRAEEDLRALEDLRADLDLRAGEDFLLERRERRAPPDREQLLHPNMADLL